MKSIMVVRKVKKRTFKIKGKWYSYMAVKKKARDTTGEPPRDRRIPITKRHNIGPLVKKLTEAVEASGGLNNTLQLSPLEREGYEKKARALRGGEKEKPAGVLERFKRAFGRDPQEEVVEREGGARRALPITEAHQIVERITDDADTQEDPLSTKQTSPGFHAMEMDGSERVVWTMAESHSFDITSIGARYRVNVDIPNAQQSPEQRNLKEPLTLELNAAMVRDMAVQELGIPTTIASGLDGTIIVEASTAGLLAIWTEMPYEVREFLDTAFDLTRRDVVLETSESETKTEALSYGSIPGSKTETRIEATVLINGRIFDITVHGGRPIFKDQILMGEYSLHIKSRDNLGTKELTNELEQEEWITVHPYDGGISINGGADELLQLWKDMPFSITQLLQQAIQEIESYRIKEADELRCCDEESGGLNAPLVRGTVLLKGVLYKVDIFDTGQFEDKVEISIIRGDGEKIGKELSSPTPAEAGTDISFRLEAGDSSLSQITFIATPDAFKEKWKTMPDPIKQLLEIATKPRE